MAENPKTALEIGNALSQAQVAGAHYAGVDISPWAVQLSLGHEVFVNGRLCDALKYLMRDKNSRLEDFNKARHVIDAAISVMEQNPEHYNK